MERYTNLRNFKLKFMIAAKLKVDFGQDLYLLTDPDQFPRTLVGVYLAPGNQVIYALSYLGEVIEAYDFETSEEENQEITLGLPKKKED